MCPPPVSRQAMLLQSLSTAQSPLLSPETLSSRRRPAKGKRLSLLFKLTGTWTCNEITEFTF